MLARASWVALLCVGCWGASRVQEADVPAETPPLVVTYLANEGVLLARGDQSVVIDAFIEKPYGPYAALSAATRAKLLAGEAPFDGLDLALTSHAHPDHVQPLFARATLEANAKLALASVPQVTSAVVEGLADDHELRARVAGFWPEDQKWLARIDAGFPVSAFRLPHAGNRPTVQNLGQTVDVGGVRVLHVGDGELSAENLIPFDLPEREIDVALVPYWWLLDARGATLVRDAIAPRVLIAIHVPPKEAQEIAATLAESAPGAIVFDVELESVEVAPR